MTRLLRSPWLPLALLAVGAVSWWARASRSQPSPPPAPTYGDFTVNTASGPLALSSLRGRAVVLYFGYTACPDVCPTTMSTVAAAYAQLPEASRARAGALLVSVDPERDELERLSSYASWFHPTFRGGTRPEPEIRRIAADWGVVYRRVELEGSALGYAVDHSTDAYLVGPDGDLVRVLPHGMPASQLATAWEAALLR